MTDDLRGPRHLERAQDKEDTATDTARLLRRHIEQERDKDRLAEAIKDLLNALLKWDESPASASMHVQQAIDRITSLV